MMIFVRKVASFSYRCIYVLKDYFLSTWNIFRAESRHKDVIRDIQRKGYANVIFFASSLSMWRYQGIYDLLSKDSRFNTIVLLVPFRTYSEEEKATCLEKLRNFFDGIGVQYEDTSKWSVEQYKIREWLSPDILFYCQQYNNSYNNILENTYFYDKLLCYAPYGVGSFVSKWAVDSIFQNVAWKLYYESDVYAGIARKNARNHGKNVVVVGNTNADAFLNSIHHYKWKIQSLPKKRVIWSPHFSINKRKMMHRDGFLWLNDMMLRIAEDYSDRIQFVFKPHPSLRSKLYSNPDWGKKRTEDYYNKWATMLNTQFEDSEFIDLFMTSDALIHDCGSFTVEYHYSKKPCLFTSRNLKEVREPLNELGRAALDAHYIGIDDNDIRSFLDKVVIDGNDPKKQEREDFFRKYLLPPNGKSVAMNIYDDIVKNLWG